MRSLILSVTLLVGSGTPAYAQETLNGEQLSALVARVKNFVPRDQFDAPPAQPSLAGKRFSYTIEPRPIGRATNCDGHPEWLYLPAQQRLNFSWGSSLALSYALKGRNGGVFPPNMMGLRNSELMFRSFTCAKTIEQNYTATNGFGAQFTIEKMTDTVSAIADFDPPTGRRLPSSWDAVVTGDAARLLSANARIRVSGTLSDWWPGASVVCGQKRLEPTISRPIDRTTDVCLIRGQVERVDVIDERSGATLYSIASEGRGDRKRR